MTEKYYLHSDDLSGPTTVLSCEPAEDGRFHLILSGTLFHPRGGGQPADTGRIGETNVIDVMQSGDALLHVTEHAVAPGDYTMVIDAEPRALNTRMHSAGHLIAVVTEEMGWRALKANHKPGEGRVVFEPAGEPGEAPDAEAIRAEAAKRVEARLPREQSLENGRRLVGWGSLPAYACGGTHVPSTDVVGEIIIETVKFKKGQLSVSYRVS